MTRAQYERELENLEREADKRGCCVVPAKPLREPRPRRSAALPHGKKEAK